MQRLTLVGYRASGKSTIGRRVAKRLGLPFIDADAAIEQAAQQTIAQIFANGGEAAFRDWETRVLKEVLAAAGDLVVATGGGAVVRPENRALLRKRGGLVVYLSAPAALLARRLRRHLGGRPSLSGQHPADEVATVLAQREPWYTEVADCTLTTENSVAQVVATICAAMNDRAGGSGMRKETTG